MKQKPKVLTAIFVILLSFRKLNRYWTLFTLCRYASPHTTPLALGRATACIRVKNPTLAYRATPPYPPVSRIQYFYTLTPSPLPPPHRPRKKVDDSRVFFYTPPPKAPTPVPPPHRPRKQVDDNSSYTIKSMEEIRMETPQESREADEKPNSMEDTLKEAMERMRRKHAMRTAGLLESTNEMAPPEDDSVSTVGPGRWWGGGGSRVD